jgi:hypothetical protein
MGGLPRWLHCPHLSRLRQPGLPRTAGRNNNLSSRRQLPMRPTLAAMSCASGSRPAALCGSTRSRSGASTCATRRQSAAVSGGSPCMKPRRPTASHPSMRTLHTSLATPSVSFSMRRCCHPVGPVLPIPRAEPRYIRQASKLAGTLGAQCRGRPCPAPWARRAWLAAR